MESIISNSIIAGVALLASAIIRNAGPNSTKEKPEGPPPLEELDQRGKWWVKAEALPSEAWRIERAVNRYESTQGRYKEVAKRGCPAPVIFVFHMRESTWSFRKHLHEGSSLQRKTRWVPKGRPPGTPPFTWEESAEDALYGIKNYGSSSKWSTISSMLDWIERYNGLGYRKYHPSVPSPYVVAGTNLQTKGKYVSDGKFDYNAWDKQLGCLIVLKKISKLTGWKAPPFK